MSRKRDRAPSSDDTENCDTTRQKPSNARLERKRELDRQAQRNIREKTRNHIAQLEALVQALQTDNDSDGKIGKLITQLKEKTTEINRLRNALDSITKITNAASSSPVNTDGGSRACTEQSEPGQEPSTGLADGRKCSTDVDQQAPGIFASSKVNFGTEYDSETSSTCCLNEAQLDTATQSLAAPFLIPPPSQPISESVNGANLTSSLMTLDTSLNALSLSQIASAIIGNTKLEGRFWYLAGTLLNHILKCPQKPLCSTAFDEDIAIRAVVEGWSAVMERYPLDRGWQWLKELDETIYFNAGVPVRLMHLRNCRLQFLHQMFPDADWNEKLPMFFQARPAQRYLYHDPLIEHFPWPSFRERLLFYPRRYATNIFMETLQQTVQFVWGYNSRELYEREPCSGLYSYSEAFLRQIKDIRCYSMKPAFFDRFPELREDIPVNDPSPLDSFLLCASSGSEVSAFTTDGYDCDNVTLLEEDPETIAHGKLSGGELSGLT